MIFCEIYQDTKITNLGALKIVLHIWQIGSVFLLQNLCLTVPSTIYQKVEFELIEAMIQALHLLIQATVTAQAAAFHETIQLSDLLYEQTPDDLIVKDVSLKYRYFLYEMTSGCQYGVIACERQHGKWVLVAVTAAISSNKAAVSALTEKCTQLQLSPVHLLDVVNDFMTQDLSSWRTSGGYFLTSLKKITLKSKRAGCKRPGTYFALSAQMHRLEQAPLSYHTYKAHWPANG